MSDKNYTKMKLLYIKDYLHKFSDEENPISTEELINHLQSHKISCEKKSIYSDVKTLKEYGYDILKTKTPRNGYYICYRDFQLPEIRLMIDAIQSANFITPKKSTQLIEKVLTLCSENQGTQLKQNAIIDNKLKSDNEEIYYNIDQINLAIKLKKQVTFKYQKKQFNSKTQEIKEVTKTHTVNPYALIWDNNYYYLLGNHTKYENLMHTRIDRMKKLKVLDTDLRDVTTLPGHESGIDISEYKKSVFNMFSGDEVSISFEFEPSILEQIIERFGVYEQVYECENRLGMKANCAMSEGLISWFMQFGSQVKIIQPLLLKEKLAERAREIWELYN